jgi:chromatin remodeling complex protein RSC6
VALLTWIAKKHVPQSTRTSGASTSKASSSSQEESVNPQNASETSSTSTTTQIGAASVNESSEPSTSNDADGPPSLMGTRIPFDWIKPLLEIQRQELPVTFENCKVEFITIQESELESSSSSQESTEAPMEVSESTAPSTPHANPEPAREGSTPTRGRRGRGRGRGRGSGNASARKTSPSRKKLGMSNFLKKEMITYDIQSELSVLMHQTLGGGEYVKALGLASDDAEGGQNATGGKKEEDVLVIVGEDFMKIGDVHVKIGVTF